MAADVGLAHVEPGRLADLETLRHAVLGPAPDEAGGEARLAADHRAGLTAAGDGIDRLAHEARFGVVGFALHAWPCLCRLRSDSTSIVPRVP